MDTAVSTFGCNLHVTELSRFRPRIAGSRPSSGFVNRRVDGFKTSRDQHVISAYSNGFYCQAISQQVQQIQS